MAKAFANDLRAPSAALKALGRAKVAAIHSAALLGMVTFHANHCPETEQKPDGTPVVRYHRDAQQPQNKWAPRAPRAAPPPPLPFEQPPAEETPEEEGTYSRQRSWRAVVRQHNARQRKEDKEHLQRRVAQVGAATSSATPNSNKLPASERLEAVARRVRAKTAG